MRTSTTCTIHRQRNGLTVVEVLVAMILVSVGLLGMAGSSALALRTAIEVAHRREAARRVAIRFSTLAAAGCKVVADGNDADATRQLTEQWSVISRSTSFATISDSISWMSAQGRKSFTITTAIPC